MAWKMSEKPKTVLASASLVKEFVEMEPAPYDRPLSERRMMVYERILNSGQFRPVVWAAATCYETNCTYRVNGKHTSLMLSKLPKIPEFYVTIERWVCDTLQDVGNLYNTYDSSLSSRSTSDINMAFAATMPVLSKVPMKLINLTVSAASFLKWSTNDLKKVPPAERAEELIDRQDFVLWLQNTVKTVDTRKQSLSKHLLRSAAVTAMMASHDRAPNIATKFWESVRDESDADRDSPSRILARFLVRATMASSRGSAKDAVGFKEMYVKCIRAWNAHRSGEATSLQYREKDPLPTVSK